MESNRNFTFPKSERLKSRKAIQSLFSTGKSFTKYPIKVVYQITDNSDHPIEVGFSVPKRNHKKAVTRNLLKRRMKESYRLQRNEVRNQLYTQQLSIQAMFILLDREVTEYAFIEKRMKQCLDKLSEIIA